MARAEAVVQKRIETAREESATAAAEAKEARKQKALQSRSAEDVARAAITKLGNQVSTKCRAVQTACYDINSAVVSQDEKDFMSVR